jgi:GH25 family lysozyme M1 (1,4-beta-N-acetylmuramidase)
MTDSVPHPTQLNTLPNRRLRFLGAWVLAVATMALAPEEARAQRLLGTDVSGWQTSVNWTTVKNAGVTFAWTKATESTGFTSDYFTTQEAGAKSVGIPIGAYHFARPSSNPNLSGTNSADSEATYFWNVAGAYIKSGGSYLVPMLDWEDTYATNGHNGITGFSAAYLSSWAIEWCNAVSNYARANGVPGLRPVIYTGAWYSKPGTYPGLTTAVINYPSWISYYPYSDGSGGYGTPYPMTDPFPSSSRCYPWTAANIWQYGDTNWSGGDSDVYAGTLTSFKQMFGVGGDNGNGATIVNRSVPSSVLTGQTFTATLTFNNIGISTWTNSGSNPYRLGSQTLQDNTTWGTNRVNMPSSPIAPGASVTFTINARAPSTPGVYTFAWEMVQEGVLWFGDIASSTLVVNLPGPGTNFGNYTLDTGYVNPTTLSGTWTTATDCSQTTHYTHLSDASCNQLTGQAKWFPGITPLQYSGRGWLQVDAFQGGTYATAPVYYHLRDSLDNDLWKSAQVNQCSYHCIPRTVYSGAFTVAGSGTLGGVHVFVTDSGTTASCATSCGSALLEAGTVRLFGSRWTYVDDWTCLGPYASSSVSDTANRSFNEANLYLYPAVDTSHGNVIATALGLNGKVPGRVTTGDCNNTNTLNFAGANNGVSPDGVAAAYGNANNADAYGFAWVFAPAGAAPQIVIGSDDGNRLWVNGVLKNDINTTRGLIRDQDNTGAVSLPAGWSRLLFKVHNNTSTFQGTVSLRNGSNANLNEPSVNYHNLGGYYSYGLGYEQDEWYPQIVVGGFYGASNPTNGAVFYGNSPTVTANGTSSGQGPVPYWRTMQYQWGYGLGNADANYTDVGGTPTSTSWSHIATGVSGHRRFHFFAVSQSGRTSFQNSGTTGGWRFQDAGNYARYFDVYVDNLPPQTPSFVSANALSTAQISLGWNIPLDQGVNVAPGATETAGGAGNQDAQNWYRVGDVAVQVYRDGSVLSPWSTGTTVTDAGLTANTAYTYALAARDNNTSKRGAWYNSTGLQSATTVWTLSVPPGAASIMASPANPHSGSNVTWTAVYGFGPGQVQYYRYAWDTLPTHTWTDTEPQWSADSLTTLPTAGGTWYLHVKGYNGADVGNGSFDYAVGVTASGSATALVSSENPALAGSDVIFTATVNTLAPDTGTPTGHVVFAANGAPFSTNALVNGTATASTTVLPAGTNTVAAQYAGDLFFMGSADSLQQVIQAACSQTNAIVGIADNHDGTFTLTFAATAHSDYYVVETSDLTEPANWTPVPGSTNTINASSGVWSCTVTNTGAQRFYRSVALTPCQ